MVKLYASLNSVKDQSNVASALEKVLNAGIDGVHMDVFDGSITSGPFAGMSSNYNDNSYVAHLIKRCTDLRGASFPIEAHLVVTNPKQHIARYICLGVDRLIVNADTIVGNKKLAILDAMREIRMAKLSRTRGGIALNPKDVSLANDFNVLISTQSIDLIASGPGYDAIPISPFFDQSISTVYKIKLKYNKTLEIEVDCGITPTNAKKLRSSGAEILVLGRALFESTDYKAFIDSVKNA